MRVCFKHDENLASCCAGRSNASVTSHLQVGAPVSVEASVRDGKCVFLNTNFCKTLRKTLRN